MREGGLQQNIRQAIPGQFWKYVEHIMYSRPFLWAYVYFIPRQDEGGGVYVKMLDFFKYVFSFFVGIIILKHGLFFPHFWNKA